MFLRCLLDQRTIFIEDQNVPIFRAHNLEIPPRLQIRKEQVSRELEAFVVGNIKPDEGDGWSSECFIIPPEHHHIMGRIRNIAGIRLIREESNFDLRSCPLLTPDIDLALDALGGDDTADNGKAQTRASLQRVLLGERVEQLVLGGEDGE